jgi:uncharacterized protein YodC (DUF2158 family)
VLLKQNDADKASYRHKRELIMQNAISLHIGYVVTLPSGSPDMVVSNPRNNNEAVTCVWFQTDASSELLSSEFQLATLNLKDSNIQNLVFRPGETVKLRNGVGPLMTVESHRGNGREQEVSCIWFGENGTARTPTTALFHPLALMKHR